MKSFDWAFMAGILVLLCRARNRLYRGSIGLEDLSVTMSA